jgi:hypothetical protein
MKLMHDASVISGNASKALKQRLLTALDPPPASRIGTPHSAKPPGPFLFSLPILLLISRLTALSWFGTRRVTEQDKSVQKPESGRASNEAGRKKGPCTNAFADGPLVHCKPTTTSCERRTAIYGL